MHRTTRNLAIALALTVLTCAAAAQNAGRSPSSATRSSGETNALRQESTPFEWGVLAQGGLGVTENRSSFKFFMAGVHAGKVLTDNMGPGMLRGDFEYAVQVFPIWQSYTPTGLRQNCTVTTGPFGVQQANCSAPFTIGGRFTGASITPIILRWNFVGKPRFAPWVQGAGGVVWTNHKYPGYGGPPAAPAGVSLNSIGANGAHDDTSVWNFTPQFGVGVHYFVRAHRSIDFAANAVHVSSASLGDRNPGVNASVQFNIGYTWWK